MKSFGDKLLEALRVNNMTQQELSELTNIPKSMISQYKSGRNDPKYINAKSICDVLKISVDWLLGEYRPIEEDMQEQVLLKSYRKLNEDGKCKVDENIRDLLEIERYTHKENFALKSIKQSNQS